MSVQGVNDMTSGNETPPPGAGRKPLEGEVLMPGARPTNGRGLGRSASRAGAPQFPSAEDLLRGFRRCWLRAVVLGLLLAAAATAVAWFVVPPQKSQARTLLLVMQETPHVIYTLDNRQDYQTFKRTQMAMVKSRMVLNAALRQEKIAELPIIKRQADPVQWLEEQLKVDYSTGPEILTISITGDNTKDLVDIVNAVSRAYLEEFVNKEYHLHQTQLEQLRTLQAKYEEKLKEKRATLRDYAEAAGSGDVVNLNLKQRIALEQLGASQRDLIQLKSDVLRLQVESAQELKREGTLAEKPIPDALLEEEMQKDTLVQIHKAQILKLEAELDEIRRNNPTKFQIVSATTQAQLDREVKGLQERRKKIQPVVEAQLRERLIGEWKTRMAQQRERLAFLEDMEKRLNEDVERLDKDSRSITKKTLDLEAFRAEIAQADDTLKRVSNQVEALTVEREAPPRVRLLEEGTVVNADQRKRQFMAAGGAGGGALLLVLFAFSWWECRALKISSTQELEGKLGLSVMGILPWIPPAARKNAQRDAYWQNALLESVDTFRTLLLHLAKTEQLRVVMITSAVGGEGKTSISSHLATSLARAGKKTLLVDCDLRKPSLHRVFELPGPSGFCELLRGEAGLAEAAQPTEVDGLSVVGGGTCDALALALLARGGISAIFAQFRQQYDFVIVDSSPVLPVTDSLLIAQEADGVLFSVLRDVSQVELIEAAYERLAVLSVPILGAVMTGTIRTEAYGRTHYTLGPAEAAGAPADEEAESAS
jgi:succinoglycan biosynthesis transport protein ExoP